MKRNNIAVITGLVALIALIWACTPKQPNEGINISSELK